MSAAIHIKDEFMGRSKVPEGFSAGRGQRFAGFLSEHPNAQLVELQVGADDKNIDAIMDLGFDAPVDERFCRVDAACILDAHAWSTVRSPDQMPQMEELKKQLALQANPTIDLIKGHKDHIILKHGKAVR